MEKLTGIGSGATGKMLTAFLIGMTLCSCKPNEPPKACPQIPVVDGFRTVVGDGGLVTLRLPEFAMIDLTQDCKQAQFIELDYLWHDGQLISEGINRFKYPDGKSIVVKAYLRSFDTSSGQLNEALPPWKFEPALPHKTYPLEMYPRAYWQDPAVRPERAPPDVLWGVRGTHNPISQRPNTVACGIVRADPARQESVVDGEFGKFGDAKCRGSVYAVRGTKAVGGTVDVWAIGVPEIDKIHNAAQKQFETFIVQD
jgi:hypothetical protein